MTFKLTRSRLSIAYGDPFKIDPPIKLGAQAVEVQLYSYLAETEPHFELVGQFSADGPVQVYKYYLPKGSYFQRTLLRFLKSCWPYLPTSITQNTEAPRIPKMACSRLAPRVTVKSVTKSGNHINMYYYPMGTNRKQTTEPVLIVEVNCLRFEGTVEAFNDYAWLYFLNER